MMKFFIILKLTNIIININNIYKISWIPDSVNSPGNGAGHQEVSGSGVQSGRLKIIPDSIAAEIKIITKISSS